jgi:hypothetical protein
MSGLVAISSRGPETLARGPRMVAALRHLPEWGALSVAADGVWLGVCGRDGDHWVADASEAAAHTGLVPAPVIAAFTGDLVNAKAVISTLGLPATSDPAAIVLAAYQRWGEQLFTRLEGIFSLALHDARAGVVLAGTDSCVVAPLNAVRLGADVLFASEAKAYFADPRFVADLDRTAWADMVATGFLMHERTLFSGISKLRHGCHWKVTGGALSCARHFDVRTLLPGTLGGRDYVERMATAARSLAAEVFDGESVLLPLTGGLDSRMLAAAMPATADASAMTFGAPSDNDCILAAQIAERRGLAYSVFPFDPAYVARHAEETVWLTEGRLNPVRNVTGNLMSGLPAARRFASGVGASAGRRYDRTRMLVPLWGWTHAGEAEFERLFTTYVEMYGLPHDRLGELLVDGDELGAVAKRRIGEMLASTRGLNVVDRLDVYQLTEAERFDQVGLEFAGVWVGPRAPMATRCWLEAMLAGASEERSDDRARLRLVRRLDPRIAAVPWGLTRLSLPVSELILSALRPVGAVTRRRLPVADSDGSSVGGPEGRRAAVLHAAAEAVKHRLYAHGEQRNHWLRGPSRAYVEEILLSDRLADHGVVSAAAVRRLWREHLSGADHGESLGLLLGIELWMRLFVDRDRPPASVGPHGEEP